MAKHIHIHFVAPTRDADPAGIKRDSDGKFSSSTGKSGAAHHQEMAARHEAHAAKAKNETEKSLHTRGMNLHKKAASAPGLSAQANSHSKAVEAGSAQGPMTSAEMNHRAAIKHAPNGPGSRIQGGAK